MVERQINIINIFSSAAISIGFFLPWIDINILGVLGLAKGTGYEIASIADFILKGTSNIGMLSIYIIPLGTLGVIISEFIQSRFLRLLCTIAVVLTFGHLVYELYLIIINVRYSFGVSINVFHLIGYGFYLSLTGILYYIYNTIS